MLSDQQRQAHKNEAGYVLSNTFSFVASACALNLSLWIMSAKEYRAGSRDHESRYDELRNECIRKWSINADDTVLRLAETFRRTLELSAKAQFFGEIPEQVLTMISMEAAIYVSDLKAVKADVESKIRASLSCAPTIEDLMGLMVFPDISTEGLEKNDVKKED